MTPASASYVFIIVSLEGPDAYSQAGGLGVRVTELGRALAELGHETHLFFVGDPRLPGEERREGGRLVLHRWSQWLSAHFPRGVYDGEEAKMRDLEASLPEYLTEAVIRPAVEAGRIPVVLAEEWQTAACTIALSDLLHERGLRRRTLIFWNANNPYGFDRIDWPRLAYTSTVTAVSRFMRGIIRSRGADALVIPNGIPRRLTSAVPRADVSALREALGDALLFFKMARWEREKGWTQAFDALRRLRERGRRAVLVARSGGPAGRGDGLRLEAASRGLSVAELEDSGEALQRIPALAHDGVDVVSLRFGVDEALARTLYAAADGVLANSVSEPFGLVGLEAMAVGGVVYTGGTGEDYAVSGRNSVVLETLDPEEIAVHAEELAHAPEHADRLRRSARHTARRFTWEKIVRLLIGRVVGQAARQGLLTLAADERVLPALRRSAVYRPAAPEETRQARAAADVRTSDEW